MLLYWTTDSEQRGGLVVSLLQSQDVEVIVVTYLQEEWKTAGISGIQRLFAGRVRFPFAAAVDLYSSSLT